MLVPSGNLDDGRLDDVTPSMRIFLGILSILSLLLAARRFSVAENVGYDIGALFLLLIGIQLFVAAVLVHEHQQSRRPQLPAATNGAENMEDDYRAKQ